MSDRSELPSGPGPTENVIAFKRDNGKVMVHGWRKQGRLWDAVTDCQREPKWHLRSWLWLEYRTLNPSLVMLCQKCWTGEQVDQT